MVVLTTSSCNTICLFHQRNRGVQTIDGRGPFTVEGSAYPKNLGNKHRPTTPKPGHIHCGCALDHAILDLFLWKTTFMKSTNPAFKNRYPESLEGTILKNRLRSYLIQVFSNWSHLKAEDLFTGRNGGWGSPAYQVRVLGTQAQRILNELGSLGYKTKISADGCTLTIESAVGDKIVANTKGGDMAEASG
jgi:hypothetical protein